MTDWLAGNGIRPAWTASRGADGKFPLTVHHVAMAAAYLFVLAVIVLL